MLRCRPERAFALFTDHAGEWWPPERRHTKDAASQIRIEASGRFYERATDGTEVELGVARLFSPPHRLLLDWFPGTGKDHPTQVEVLFEAQGAGTRVTIIHRAGRAGDVLFEGKVSAYLGSWDLVLAALSSQS